MVLFYHSLVTLVFVASLPFLPLVWLFSTKRRANLLQRLGLATGLGKARGTGFCIWIHALSVGEVHSAVPLVREFRARHPRARIIFTAATRTGFETARELMAGSEKAPGLLDGLGYFPFDLWFAVARVVSKIKPDLVCLVETDLWPGFLSMMKQRGIPVVLVNARLSCRAHQGFCHLRPLLGPMFSSLAHVMAQTDLDARRFCEVGGVPARISVSGNIKFDRPPPHFTPEDLESIRRDLGQGAQIQGDQVWIAGSTHPGEEDMVVQAFGDVKASFPELRLVIAPRDPNRSPALSKRFSLQGFKTACLSDPPIQKETADILFIDSLGKLVQAYAIGGPAFVGGSLVNLGGHNPLEPAMFGKPVLFGPHMGDFHEVAQMLLSAGGGLEASSATDLAQTLLRLLETPGQMEGMGRAAARVFSENQGAVARTLDIMEAQGLV